MSESLPPELLSPPILLAAAAVLLAGIVRGFSGFGAAMIMVPVLAALYGPVRAVPVALFLEMAISLPLLPAAVRIVDWRRLGLLLGAACASVPLGVWALHALDEGMVRYALSGIVVGAVILLATGWRYGGRPGLAPTLATGVLSGAMNGLAGMAGPPVVFFYLAGNDGAAVSRASFIVYFAAIDLFALAVFAVAGAYDWLALALAGALAIPFLLGGYVGARLFGRAGERFYRIVALAILSLIAVGSLAL